MHALIVVAHPDKNSLTHAVASELSNGIVSNNSSHSFEFNNLAEEKFDPRFSSADLALFRNQASPPADVVAEQSRIDRADALVLVYPVYWWSFPGLLKGWIDRVFTNGWAYDEDADGNPVKKLGRLQVHLVGIGASDLRTYARHGYQAAMRTQIDHGIFEYVGARVASSELLLLTSTGAESHLETSRRIGRQIFG
ncbi:NAD(P)H-dependent oxidoreductase [Paraburkholderia xenovorans]|uniref:NAD(P)H-dependent oxidoreductase n=1 Tax=Paraburkholderia xenovorans TaxID=36873 RepID=UPI0038BA0FB0